LRAKSARDTAVSEPTIMGEGDSSALKEAFEPPRIS
jgi:hypothetical protein